MTERPSTFAALSAFLFSLLCLTASTVVFSLMSVFGLRTGYFSYLYSAVLQGIAFAVPAFLYYQRHKEIRPALRLNRLDPVCAVLVILAALAGVIALNWLSVYWSLFLDSLGLVTGTGASLIPRTPTELLLSMVTSALLPALFEELLFRGFLLPSLERLGRWTAVLLCGVLFALPHASLEALPAHLLLGVALCWLVLLTNSLFASMLFHGVYNATIILLSYRSMQADPAGASALPMAEDALSAMPMVVVLAGVFWLLLYAAMDRGRNKAKSPLPTPAYTPLAGREKLLLAISLLLLLGLLAYTVITMLPGASA